MKKKMKILCSFGGKISDGPSAGNLLYIGGTTRVIRISDDTSWQQLREKTMAIYKQPHTIKYQLPGEDLDALVSVFCDEDLQLMMEFGDVGGSTGLEKLFSMFLFAGDSADPQAQQSDASRASAEGKLASGSSTSDYDPPPRSPPGKSELSRAASASADDRHALQVEKPIGKAEENLGAAASENELHFRGTLRADESDDWLGLISLFENVPAIAVATEYTFPQAENIKEYRKDPNKLAAAATEITAAPAAAKKTQRKVVCADESDDDLGLTRLFENVPAVAVATEYTYPRAGKVREHLKDPSKFVFAAEEITTAPAVAKKTQKKVVHADEPDDVMGLIRLFENAPSVAVATEYTYPRAGKVREHLKDPSKFVFAAEEITTAPAVAKKTQRKVVHADESDDVMCLIRLFENAPAVAVATKYTHPQAGEVRRHVKAPAAANKKAAAKEKKKKEVRSDDGLGLTRLFS